MSKRLFDMVFSVSGLLFLAPAFVIIAILIKTDSKGPVFFRQKRIGKRGVSFYIFKFRTMQAIQSKKGLKITVGNDVRVTKIGVFLRKYKIDELPQLINIIKGEMSFVGPRPEVPEYVEHYSDKNREIVLSVRPGITDLASIEFRNENEILDTEENPEKAYIEKILPEKLKYCRLYVENQSLWGDVKIILRTIRAVI